ncbi:MAG: hypothetical protein LPH20_03345 [Shewanella sp.]|nr:hypothetical protein [Shewanella sp.]
MIIGGGLISSGCRKSCIYDSREDIHNPLLQLASSLSLLSARIGILLLWLGR